MEREEILQKAQRETDEMLIQVRDKSVKVTYTALVLSAAVFAFIRGMAGQPVMDLGATVCCSVFAGRVYCFIRTKEKFDLVMAVLTLLASIAATISFFMGY